MCYPLEEVAAIDPPARARLAVAGVTTTRALLKACRFPVQRARLATATGIEEARLLAWTHRADLLRITGLGPLFADLLAAEGVATLAALRQAAPEGLHQRLTRRNRQVRLVRVSPPVALVRRWVDQAGRIVPWIHPDPAPGSAAPTRARIAMQ
jgi:hypothetical protein